MFIFAINLYFKFCFRVKKVNILMLKITLFKKKLILVYLVNCCLGLLKLFMDLHHEIKINFCTTKSKYSARIIDLIIIIILKSIMKFRNFFPE